jgi:hypothetical protein
MATSFEQSALPSTKGLFANVSIYMKCLFYRGDPRFLAECMANRMDQPLDQLRFQCSRSVGRTFQAPTDAYDLQTLSGVFTSDTFYYWPGDFIYALPYGQEEFEKDEKGELHPLRGSDSFSQSRLAAHPSLPFLYFVTCTGSSQLVQAYYKNHQWVTKRKDLPVGNLWLLEQFVERDYVLLVSTSLDHYGQFGMLTFLILNHRLEFCYSQSIYWKDVFPRFIAYKNAASESIRPYWAFDGRYLLVLGGSPEEYLFAESFDLWTGQTHSMDLSIARGVAIFNAVQCGSKLVVMDHTSTLYAIGCKRKE